MSVRLAVRALRGALPLLLLVGAFLVAGPRELGGPASYVIVSGDSMEPTYRDGDLIIARQRSSYAVGEVITYRPDVGADFPVIHRVVATSPDELVTRGDNRNEDDAWPIAPDDVVGATWLRIPSGGTALNLLVQPAVLVALVVFAGVVALIGRGERRRAAAPAPAADGPDAEADAAADARSSRRLLVAVVAVASVGGIATGVAVGIASASSLEVRAPVLQVAEVERSTPPG